MELDISANKLCHILGRNGSWQQQTAKETRTQIHFENAPFSSNSKVNRCPDFNLDAFQSPAPLKVKIAGQNLEDVQKAADAVKKREAIVQV